MHAVKPQMPGVPDHVEECDCTGPALCRIHPIACPRIIGDVALAAPPDIEAVERVIKNWQPYDEQFQSHDERNAAEKCNLTGIGSRPFGRKGIRDKMLN